MMSKETIKSFQQTLENLEEKNGVILTQLKQLETAKKEKAAKPILNSLNELLGDYVDAVEKVESESKDIHQEIVKKVTKKKDLKKKESAKDKHALLSEQQQKMIDLKSKLTRNVEIQTQHINDEVSLHRMLRPQTQPSPRRLDEEPIIHIMSKTSSLRMLRMFEKKSMDANAKLKEMELELNRTKEKLTKYQHLYELEKRRLPAGGRPRMKSGKKEAQENTDDEEDAIDFRMPPESSYSLLGETVRVNDVIRKNEFLMEENKKLRNEIKRLKEDNNTLLKKAKQAMDSRDTVMHHLQTSESNRKTLSKRLDKEKTEHTLLSRSVTRQASDWILLKKQLAQLDEEYRLVQLNPMSVTGAEQRYYVHPSTRNTYMPRKMYPTEQYALANQN